ncbi:hypothetical protein JHK87_050578 [Glycine soja]|nr:hypothetical protein JHK87_050578 [Glycine soja]
MARCPGVAANLCCLFFHHHHEPSPPPDTLGILAFDAAKTMCRLVSLYNSLDHQEILHLRRHVIRSKSVSKLNSRDECFLLTLACASRLEDLNLSAATVSRLATRCSDRNLARCFESVDARKLEFGTKDVESKIENMEKLVCATQSLHKAMESLTEMEALERKMQKWRAIRANHGLKVKVECFNDKIMFYQRQVVYFKQVSLWNQTFDKVVGLMARIVCIVYNRICSVFGTFVTGDVKRRNLNNNNNNGVVKRHIVENSCCRIEHRELYRMNLCMFDQTEEALKKRAWGCCNARKRAPTEVFRFHHAPPREGGEVSGNNHVMRLAPENTVGGAGLSLRLKVKLRGKLKSEWLEWEKLEGGEEEHSAAATRRHAAAAEVMEILVPVAHDMVRWQAERNLEKQKFETKPTVLLLQTLHYSDLEKVEEVIVEVLVGLSYMYWNRNL